MTTIANHEVTVIFDNAGGTTVQISDFGCGMVYAHHYDDPRAARRDVDAFFSGPDVSTWDGHEAEAEGLDPTQDQISNGGYRVATFNSSEELAEFIAVDGWANSIEFGLSDERINRMRADAERDGDANSVGVCDAAIAGSMSALATIRGWVRDQQI